MDNGLLHKKQRLASEAYRVATAWPLAEVESGRSTRMLPHAYLGPASWRLTLAAWGFRGRRASQFDGLCEHRSHEW